jgi:hypothetical protein
MGRMRSADESGRRDAFRLLLPSSSSNDGSQEVQPGCIGVQGRIGRVVVTQSRPSGLLSREEVT